MAVWSVEEQVIPTPVFAQDQHAHLVSITLRSDSNAAVVIMELHTEPDAESETPLYTLRFNRNGAYIGAERTMLPPTGATGGGSSAHAHAASRGRK